MEFELRCEGFWLDDALRDRLLMVGRRAMVASGWDRPLSALIRHIEGRMQVRLELQLPGRRIFTVVWRDDPVEAMEKAVDALVCAAFGGPEGPASERLRSGFSGEAVPAPA
jgi:hypothetical protein